MRCQHWMVCRFERGIKLRAQSVHAAAQAKGTEWTCKAGQATHSRLENSVIAHDTLTNVIKARSADSCAPWNLRQCGKTPRPPEWFRHLTTLRYGRVDPLNTKVADRNATPHAVVSLVPLVLSAHEPEAAGQHPPPLGVGLAAAAAELEGADTDPVLCGGGVCR